jgi:hypothetical protein
LKIDIVEQGLSISMIDSCTVEHGLNSRALVSSNRPLRLEACVSCIRKVNCIRSVSLVQKDDVGRNNRVENVGGEVQLWVGLQVRKSGQSVKLKGPRIQLVLQRGLG